MECEHCYILVTVYIFFAPSCEIIFAGRFGHNGTHNMEISGFHYKNNKHGCVVEGMKLCDLVVFVVYSIPF